MTITIIETHIPDYFPAKTFTSPLIETYKGWVQYVTDEEGLLIQRIWHTES